MGGGGGGGGVFPFLHQYEGKHQPANHTIQHNVKLTNCLATYLKISYLLVFMQSLWIPADNSLHVPLANGDCIDTASSLCGSACVVENKCSRQSQCQDSNPMHALWAGGGGGGGY